MKPILTKIALLLILATLAASMTSCKGNTNDKYAPPTGYTLASDENADYCLYVPDDWTVDYSTMAAGAYCSKSDPSSVSVMAWELEYTDSTIDDWWKTNKEDVALVFTDFELTSEENATINDLYAKKYTYTATLGVNNYKFLQEACIKNGAVYVFTYSSLEESFDTHLEEVEQIINFLIIK